MTALDHITIKGFKSIANIEKLELRPVNLIIGANGSGKSNFIGVFSFLNAIRSGNLKEYVGKFGGANNLLFLGSKITEQIELEVSFNKNVNQYSIVLAQTQDDNLIPTNETVYYWKKSYPDPYSDRLQPARGEAGISDMTQAGIASHIRTHLDSWRVYHFHDTSVNSPLKRTEDINDNRFFRPDGSNLAAFLYFLKSKHEPAYSLIHRTVERVAPFLKSFVLEPLALNETKIRLEWKHQGTEDFFDVSSLSDGTLRFIALATLLLQPLTLRPSVILIDEPELGLHPYAITMLASLIKQASIHTQIILSTQSSLLLDHFEPEDVLVANLVDGSTQLTRLSSEELKVWLEDYSLGELWEKNEIGGRPGGR